MNHTANDSFIALRDIYRIASIALAIIIGWLAWSNKIPTLALALLLPAFWARAFSRLDAGIIVLVYYLAAARGLPQGTRIFFGEDAPAYLGIVLWLLASLLLTLPWIALWPSKKIGYSWRLLLVFLLVSLPPIGIVGWANPLTAAGTLFPGWGWVGLLVCYTLMVLSCKASFKQCLWLIAGVLLFSIKSILYKEPILDWQIHDTKYGGLASGSYDFMRFYTINTQILKEVTKLPANTISIYPETLLGLWTPTAETLWQKTSKELAKRNARLLIGAELPLSNGQYDNIILSLGKEAGIKYRQRVPVPISMWQPFSKIGVRAHWWESGVFALANHRVAGLICYEQLLVWPVLVSFLYKPQAIIGLSNAWWSRDTSIPGIQQTVLRAWARLFDVPLASAINQ